MSGPDKAASPVYDRGWSDREGWHDDDCGGFPACNGCGWIDSDLRWWAGPCPESESPHQAVRSERGIPWVESKSLQLVPISLRAANAWVDKVHRHHGSVRGHKFSIAVEADGVLVGVAIAGRPLARKFDNGHRLEVLRVATDGADNACSMLYGACARAGVGMGYKRHNIFTYILESESGTSLRASGWVPVARTSGGAWSRESRVRDDRHPLEGKIRWHAELPPDAERLDLTGPDNTDSPASGVEP